MNVLLPGGQGNDATSVHFTGRWCIQTNANVGLKDHADIISSVSNRQSDWVLFGGLDQLHDLKKRKKKKKEIIFFNMLIIVTTFNAVCLYLCFLERRHSTAKYGAAIAADF